MKRFSEQFHKEASRVSLRAAERRELRERIMAYMEYHPLPQQARQPNVRTEPFILWRLPLSQWRSAAAMSFMLALLVVPFAAEQTVPGDILYPVKVQFNEEVRSTLAFSSYEKVEWETKRLERRLAEARLLASEGKLTDEVEAEVAAAVKVHSEAVQRGVEEIRQNDQEAGAIAQVAFATTLDAQAETFRAAVANSGNVADENVILADALSTAQVVANQESAAPSFERLLARVESETTVAYEMLASLDRDVDELTKRDIERRLGDVERSLRQAVALVDTDALALVPTEDQQTGAPEAATMTMLVPVEGDGSETTDTAPPSSVAAIPEAEVAAVDPQAARDEAIALLRAALKSTQKLILYMGDLELASRVSVDTLVPVVPTPEEEIDTLSRRQQALVDTIMALQAQAGEAPSEKVSYTLNELTALEGRITVAIAVGEFASARTSLDEAESLVADLARVLEPTILPAVPVTPALPVQPDTATGTATSTVEGAATTTRATTSATSAPSNEVS